MWSDGTSGAFGDGQAVDPRTLVPPIGEGGTLSPRSTSIPRRFDVVPDSHAYE
jgi:hypothetical protein